MPPAAPSIGDRVNFLARVLVGRDQTPNPDQLRTGAPTRLVRTFGLVMGGRLIGGVPVLDLMVLVPRRGWVQYEDAPLDPTETIPDSWSPRTAT